MDNIELIYMLPDAEGGVASVINNLLLFSQNDNIKKKIILFREHGAGKKTSCSFNCNEVISIEFDKYESKYSRCNKIRKHIDSNSIIIANDGHMEFSTIEIFKLNNPVIYILHGDFDYYFNIIAKYSYLIDAVIPVSQYLLRKVQEQILPPHNFILKNISFPLPSVPFKKKETANINIVYVGAINEHKGAQFFKPFVESLRSNNVDFHFNIVGVGDLFDNLKEEFFNSTNVRLHGSLSYDEIIKIHSESDIIILFSRGEGLPVAIVEGMKCGVVPIVFYLESGIPEIIKDGETGYIVEPGNISDIVNKIEAISKNKNILQEMSTKARLHANAMFDPFLQTQAYEDIFLQCIKNKRMVQWKFISLKQRIASYMPIWLLKSLN